MTHLVQWTTPDQAVRHHTEGFDDIRAAELFVEGLRETGVRQFVIFRGGWDE